MSELDIVAAGREAVERIVCYDALSTQWNGRRDSDIVNELCDEVERLQAALTKQETYCNTYHIYNGRELGDSK